jgi:hypothetical protein
MDTSIPKQAEISTMPENSRTVIIQLIKYNIPNTEFS